jgi:hypothetical protein
MCVVIDDDDRKEFLLFELTKSEKRKQKHNIVFSQEQIEQNSTMSLNIYSPVSHLGGDLVETLIQRLR